MEPRERRGGGQGSGVIVSPDGYVLTNNHVIDGAKTVTITLPDKREFKGRIVGSDPKTDIAVIKIDGTTFPPFPGATPAGFKSVNMCWQSEILLD